MRHQHLPGEGVVLDFFPHGGQDILNSVQFSTQYIHRIFLVIANWPGPDRF